MHRGGGPEVSSCSGGGGGQRCDDLGSDRDRGASPLPLPKSTQEQGVVPFLPSDVSKHGQSSGDPRGSEPERSFVNKPEDICIFLVLTL